MKLPAAWLVIVFLFSGAPTESPAPNAQALHKRYGDASIEFFDVGGGIALAVQYGPDRVACELLIGHEQSLIQRDSQPPPPVSSAAVSDLLQELVPVATRGKQIAADTTSIETTTLLKTDYETVSIRRECSAPSCVSSNQNQDIRTLVVFKRSVCPTHF
jgi:hypothetical protein